MDQRTETSPSSPGPDDGFAHESRGSRRARRRRRRRRLVLLIVPAALALLAVGAFAADVVAYRGRVHPGVEIAGTDLGRMNRSEVVASLRETASELGGQPISFRWDGATFRTTADHLGWRPDVEATADAALAVGREGPPWRDALVRGLAHARPTSIDWEATWVGSTTRGVVRPWTREVGAAPTEGRVSVREGEIVTRNPAPGRQIAVDQIVELARAVVEARSDGDFELPVVPSQPRTSVEDVRAAAEEVADLIDGPATAVLGPIEVTFSPEQLGGLLRTRVVDEGGEGRLEVVMPPKRVEELLAPYRGDVEVAPRPATLTVVSGRVQISPSENGRRIDPEKAARNLLRIASSPDRRGRVPLAVAKPELTTRAAKALGIRERLSTFTTFHAAGEPRVTNIHLAADILDGAVVMPGEEFSLNGRVGERTADRGFVEAPVIYDGEFTSDIGGGTSQLATTTFNAAFFAGLPFLEYQPHSYYISRYPMGREATVSYPKPDLRFVNDLPDPVLIVTGYTGSSITVEVWGQRTDRRVTATEPVVTGRGSNGFTVVVRRIVREGGETTRTDTFTTFYRYG